MGSVRVRRLFGRGAVLGLLVTLLVLGGVRAPSAVAVPVGPENAGPLPQCHGAAVADAPSGMLSIDGGDLPPTSAAGVTVHYSFHLSYEMYLESTGALLAWGCAPRTANVTTDASGAFGFLSVLPALDCSGKPVVCLSYGGVYGPSVLAPTSTPVGYSLSVGGGPTVVALTWVWDLASVELTPTATSLTVAPGAPTSIGAEGRMANGTATPLIPTFTWSLNGSGWSFVGAPAGGLATVVATPGAAVGYLEVLASATVSGIELISPPATIALWEQPTVIEQGDLERTTVDAGSTVPVHLIAVGAEGYPYSAVVNPGLGLPAVPAACLVSPSGGGIADVNCTANLTYPAAGIAQPTARLTNGFSSSGWQFPDLTVNPTPELSVAPSSPVGYTSTPLPIDLVAAPGSGAPPYAKACLSLGGDPVKCDTTAGPTWEFWPSFDTPGRYAATGWAIDADGANASVSFVVTIVPPLTLSPIAAVSQNVSVGVPVALSASIGGGDLPIRYWWNASDAGGSVLAGTSSSDGSLEIAFVASSSGSVTVTLTAIDAAGTFVEVDRLLSVAADAAISISAIHRPPATPVGAGSPFDVAWEAIDRSGAPVRDFAATATLDLSRAGVPAFGWINASGIGPLAYLGNGSYAVPSWGWVAGVLNVSITVRAAGILSVSLHGTALPAPPGSLAVAIAPDRAHLLLFDPLVAEAGARTNSTFWHVTDRFGNPAVGALLTVLLRWPGGSRTTLVAAVLGENGSTGAWVNYSAPGPGEGNVTVLDAAGAVLLGPIGIPAVAAPSPINPTTVTLAAAVPIGAIGAAWSGIVQR
ncbi:MAG: hypothetical protein WBG19_04465, partial [Thermoplasmata archaeon]